MAFCLIPKLAEEFKARLRSGEISPEKLNAMDSAQRKQYFAEFMGPENATQTNALFESKILLKNQQRGYINWARQVAGLKPEARKSLVEKINKMDRVFDPAEEAAFLNDLANKKLGMDVSFDEVKKISELANEVESKKATMESGGDRLDYGRALYDFNQYVEGLKHQSKKITMQDFKKNPVLTSGKLLVKGAGLSKSMLASLDNSAIGRQGLKVMLNTKTNGIWRKNALQSFKDIVNTFGGKNVDREVAADILSRKNALNGLYKKEGLALGGAEEAYPTNLPERIPYIGRAFKASESAYKNFMLRTRADVFDKLYEIAEASGADTQGLGKLVNSMTGRAHLGIAEGSAEALNNLFFSPRFLKSQVDFLTAHTFDKNISPYVRKQAAVNLLQTASAIAGILTIADALMPGSVEKDPRSTDFGKIKSGSTRFDVSGGMASLVTLASRIIASSSKSTKTGKVNSLNSGKFGSNRGEDIIFDFMNNKLSPAAQFIRDVFINRSGRMGEELTPGGVAMNLLAPLPVQNYVESSQNVDAANQLLIMIADGLGISANTY